MTYTRRTITETGCYLDNHRGHYLLRDMIWLAKEWGYIVSETESFALDMYEAHSGDENYPFQSIVELSDEALVWLNCGDNEGRDRAIRGQNSPPIIPEGYAWGWNDGDFGLYPYVLFSIGHEDSNGHSHIATEVTMMEARSILTQHNAREDVIERLLGQSPEDMALQAGGFIVTAIEPL